MTSISRKIDHPKSIWTWRFNKRGRGRVTLYIPYLQSISCKRKRYRIEYNGGEVEFKLKDVECILLYGACGDLPVSFLDELSKYKICLIIHRRNMSMPYCFLPAVGTDRDDLLTRQVLARENLKKRVYIARTLIRERLDSMAWLINWPDRDRVLLKQSRQIDKVRILEAKHTKRYWQAFFALLGEPKLNRRDSNHAINSALDAASVFLTSIILRWCIYHRLSPSHAYLHEQTSYPSLIYDLVEPYRYLIEKAVHAAWLDGRELKLEARTINKLSEFLDQDVYVHATRQVAARKNLMHGIVLALRDYLISEQGRGQRFVVPAESERTGGRPMKVGYNIPGGRCV